ncbi:MAG: ROK family protein [Propionibacteriaceae bacterium]|jgi:predicted NBD/HSP70 family sugar kinase|nr:ROK family protein [Propionibacteriaceae bacterium]
MNEPSDALLVSTLRARGPLTRHGLAQVSGLSFATVNRVLPRLVAGGLVRAVGHELSTGGRPPELFAYDGAGLVIAGVSVTDAGATGLVLTPGGEIVGRYEEGFAAAVDSEARLRATVRLLESIAGQTHGQLGGIGVGVPGVVSGPAGTVTAIHEMGWERLALGEVLNRAANRPVVLDNDANCLAVAEHWRGAGRGVDNLVALIARNGLGAGLITNGQLYRGLHHEAGEIGYLLTERQSLQRLFPERGELEQRIGGGQLLGEARRLGAPEPGQATLPYFIRQGLGAEGPARDLAEELLDLVALAISALCVVLDPEVVILGGDDDRAGTETMIAGVQERLVGRILRVPRLEPAALGADAVMVGAARLAMPDLV